MHSRNNPLPQYGRRGSRVAGQSLDPGDVVRAHDHHGRIREPGVPTPDGAYEPTPPHVVDPADEDQALPREARDFLAAVLPNPARHPDPREVSGEMEWDVRRGRSDARRSRSTRSRPRRQAFARASPAAEAPLPTAP
ncbi:hypothetical protein [Embleya hyalina]|uniref:Uncharacterized protein n=1 Tax=Embleya hyalina TaxID=516124 RepID=A0A401YNF5_9ACTN|nr:hypothetical protein [Embleya hyalina]GCD96143.1 hypothetical protein EHYA_03827 [Embleya hyalina]